MPSGGQNKLSLEKRKEVALKIMTQGRKNAPLVAKETGVSLSTVYRIRSLIEKYKYLTPEEVKKNPELAKVYDKVFGEWIQERKRELTAMFLDRAKAFLVNISPEKLKKTSAYQSVLSAKIALDAAQQASGKSLQGETRQVNIYLPGSSKDEKKHEWKVIDVKKVEDGGKD